MSDSPNFVHLHCHSHYSLLDGASRIGDLISKAKDNGMNALALTDHGNLYGSLEFYQKAKAAEINPILGYEAYVAPGSRFKKEASRMKEASYHLTLLAKNKTGFRNLIKLASRAFLEGFYYKPRIDKELLKEFSEGIICLSGCVSSEFNSAILSGQDPDLTKTKEIAGWYHDVFKDNFYVEIQNNGLQIQQDAMAGAIDVANQMGLPLVATSDAHYVNKEDAEAQDILLCINTGRYRTDKNRMKMDGNEFYLRSADEMLPFFPGLDDAIQRSQEIADSVDIDLELGKRYFPTMKLPEGKNPNGYLRELCIKGLKERYEDNEEMCPNGELADVVMERLDRELGVIETLGFPNYFLIVWDFINFAKDSNIAVTARGSGVGAIVCFALYMSHVCPIKYDLLFERFLDVSRLEAPDIDIDFEKERRGEVIQYVREKYGYDNVAQIGTFGTLAARAAIRDVGRALNIPLFRVDQIVAMVPDQLGISIKKAIAESDEMNKTYDSDPEVKELLDLAQKVEGLARNIGTHAAAVVIADLPLENYVPLQRVTGKEDVITQWAMADVETSGLLKMDFLGLRNLTILSNCVNLIEQTTGERINPQKFPLDDEPTYGLLCRGETKGVFQLESGGIRDLLTRMKPDNFLDIIATAALYRPGPLEGGMVDQYIEVKHGRQEAEYKTPVMKEILEETHGVMVYQEQVMRILNRLGGIELSNAYTCIKAISKKKLPIIAKFFEQFIEGAKDNGFSKKEATDLFEMIKKFAGYGFNKSHSTAYALIAYQTAYLKTHYPSEFMAALLSGDIDGRNFKRKDSLVEHIEDCKRMAIEVIPPCVNQSLPIFGVEDGKITFGLTAVKACGLPAAEALVAEREKNGPYKDLFDFCSRVDPKSVSKSTLEALVKAGAFDFCGAPRHQMFLSIEKAVQSGAADHADRKAGQKNLFADIEDDDEQGPATHAMPDVEEWPERQKANFEKEVLGFYLSSHPLAEFQDKLDMFCSHNTQDAAALPHKAEAILGGMISSIKFSNTRKPRDPNGPTRYAMWDLEDKEGGMRCIMWPNQFVDYGHLVEDDAVYGVRGRIDKRPGSDEANFIVDELIPIEELENRYTKGVIVRVVEDEHDESILDDLHEIFRGYPGKTDIQFAFYMADGSKVYCKSEKLRVNLDPEMRRRIVELLGEENFRLISSRNGKKRKNRQNPSNPTPIGV
jgi:DNA polymerase-3 subunit alpha